MLVEEPGRVDPAAASDLDAANADLRRLARDIAADGVSPTHLSRRRRRTRAPEDSDHEDSDHEEGR